MLDCLFIVGLLAANIADNGWHAIHYQERVAMPLNIDHIPALKAAGVTIRTNVHARFLASWRILTPALAPMRVAPASTMLLASA